ncbi:uncharacterized protein LOC129279266 [Lytechinus pictus]|uniref:uncharacterized protein LOC129279266 n=1 Tax=Lytechinus pictus TaxID=7653 RepID=UPI0030B9F0ED
MGCGSSQTAFIRDMYREPSEFDTCSTVLSGRENRGEPDGKEVSPTVGDPLLKKDSNNLNTKPTSRSPYLSKREDIPCKNKTPRRSEPYKNGQKVVFTALSEQNEHDGRGVRHKMRKTTTDDDGEIMNDGELATLRGVPDEDRDLLVAT